MYCNKKWNVKNKIKIDYNTLINNTKKPTKTILFLILSFKKNL